MEETLTAIPKSSPHVAPALPTTEEFSSFFSCQQSVTPQALLEGQQNDNLNTNFVSLQLTHLEEGDHLKKNKLKTGAT